MLENIYRPRVYVAGPMSKGDKEANVVNGMRVGAKLLELGYAPFVPHLSYYHDSVFPQDYETWLEMDFAWVSVSQAVFRIEGFSFGADRECALARILAIPIVTSFEELEALNLKRKAA